MTYELLAKGYNLSKISGILRVSVATTSMDASFLYQRAAKEMETYLAEKLPLIYSASYEGISLVITKAWQMIDDPHTPVGVKASLLALVADCCEMRLDISTGAGVIDSGIKYANAAKHQYDKIISVGDQESKDMLHEEGEGGGGGGEEIEGEDDGEVGRQEEKKKKNNNNNNRHRSNNIFSNNNNNNNNADTNNNHNNINSDKQQQTDNNNNSNSSSNNNSSNNSNNNNNNKDDNNNKDKQTRNSIF